MNSKIIDEIKELYYYFDITDNYYIKSYIWYILSDLKDNIPYNQQIQKMFYNINEKLSTLTDDIFKEDNEVKEYIKENLDFFKKMITLPKKYSPCSNKSLTVFFKDELLDIFNRFLKCLNNDIYSFYQKIHDEGRIQFGNHNHTIYTSVNTSKTLVFIKELKTNYDLLALAHELSHAYYIYLMNQKIGDRGYTLDRFKEEIPPMIMEVKFIKFLYDNGFSDDALICQNEFDILMNICYRKIDDFILLKNLIGLYIARNIDYNKDIINLLEYIHNGNINELLHEVNNQKKEGKILVKYSSFS